MTINILVKIDENISQLQPDLNFFQADEELEWIVAFIEDGINDFFSRFWLNINTERINKDKVKINLSRVDGQNYVIEIEKQEDDSSSFVLTAERD